MICTTFKNKSFIEIKKIFSNYEFPELRLDLNNVTIDEFEELLSINKKIILNPGNNSVEYSQFIDLAIENNVAYVDINYDDKILESFDRKKTDLICSYHNFKRTPYEFGLVEIIEKMNKHNPDLKKIIVTANNSNDVLRIFQIYNLHNNIIAFCMGLNGSYSRFTAYMLGSPFIYAAVDNDSKTAEGQPTMEEVNKIINICKK